MNLLHFACVCRSPRRLSSRTKASKFGYSRGPAGTTVFFGQNANAHIPHMCSKCRRQAWAVLQRHVTWRPSLGCKCNNITRIQSPAKNFSSSDTLRSSTSLRGWSMSIAPAWSKFRNLVMVAVNESMYPSCRGPVEKINMSTTHKFFKL